MLVIVSKEAASKLDNSMFPVEGCYEEGYVYNENIFFIEGITDEDMCVVKATCLVNKEENTLYDHSRWDSITSYTVEGYVVDLYCSGPDQLFVVKDGEGHTVDTLYNDTLGDNWIMTAGEAVQQICNPRPSEWAEFETSAAYEAAWEASEAMLAAN